MKRLALAVLLLFATSVGQKQPYSDDGYWWIGCPEAFKTGFITGYTKAMTAVSDLAFARCIVDKNGGVVPEKFGKEVFDECAQRGDVTTPLHAGGIRIGQMKDGVDEFYKDFRNKNIDVGTALQYVVDQLQGKKTAKELEDDLTRYRKNFAK